jgi:outer membrane protein assembly factor BamB
MSHRQPLSQHNGSIRQQPKRWLLHSIVALGMIAVFSGCATPSPSPAQKPVPSLSPEQEHSIYYAKLDEQGELTLSPLRSTVTSLDATNGRLRWQAHADDETFAPVVAYGLVFVVVVSTVPNKSDALQAIDTTTGKVRWTFHYPGPGRLLPIAACHLIVISWAMNNQPYQSLGIDPASGAVRWRFSGIPVGEFPTAQGNLLYYFARSQGNTEGSVAALNLCSGTMAWSEPVSIASPACGTSPIVNGTIVVADCVPSATLLARPFQLVIPTLAAYNAATGALLWQGERGQPQVGPSRAIASGGNLYLVENRGIQAYAIKTGALLWQDQRAGSYIPLNFTVFGSDNLAFVIEPPGVVARDATTGKARWQFAGEIDEWYFDESGGVLYLTDGATTVTALDLATGAKLWQYQDQDITARLDTPLVVGDMLLLSRVILPAGGQHSWLITLHRKDGKLAWQFDTGFLPAFPTIGP